MTSEYILLRCDGSLGCNCPEIRRKIASRKYQKSKNRAARLRAKKLGNDETDD